MSRHKKVRMKETGRSGDLGDAARVLNDDSSPDTEWVQVAIVEPPYYGELLMWALYRHLDLEGWRIVKTQGRGDSAPKYIDVHTGIGEAQNLLSEGILKVTKDGDRLSMVVDVDVDFDFPSRVVVTSPATAREEVERFARAIWETMREENFYRGKKLELGDRIRFMNVAARSWDSIVLDQATKDDIWANTVGFLASREQLREYGVDCKRGVLLGGSPGTGKTVACKALMSEIQGVTCIVANSDLHHSGGYMRTLYQIARDLAPSIVFIEDVDIISQTRAQRGYASGTALLSLLYVLDGIEENEEIVTLATTNDVTSIDAAIAQRPSRFDRVIELPLPSLEQRRLLISGFCEMIPLHEDVRECIARKTDKLSPAQIQEVVRSLVIRHVQSNGGEKSACLTFTAKEVDDVIARIPRVCRRGLGFFSSRESQAGGDGECGVHGS